MNDVVREKLKSKASKKNITNVHRGSAEAVTHPGAVTSHLNDQSRGNGDA